MPWSARSRATPATIYEDRITSLSAFIGSALELLQSAFGMAVIGHVEPIVETTYSAPTLSHSKPTAFGMRRHMTRRCVRPPSHRRVLDRVRKYSFWSPGEKCEVNLSL